MRRLAASLLFLLLVARVFMPTLPSFICHEMGGSHVLGPCCAEDDTNFAGPSLSSARCCEQEAQAKLDIQRAPQGDLDIAFEPPALLASYLIPPPDVRPLLQPLTLHAGAPPTGPPPPLRQVLRI